MLYSKGDNTPPWRTPLKIRRWFHSTPSHLTTIFNLRYQLTIVLIKITGRCLFIKVENDLKWLSLSTALEASGDAI